MSKPLIETLINTSALAFTSYAINEILRENYYGFLVLGIGMGLEFAKYYGRKIKLWR